MTNSQIASLVASVTAIAAIILGVVDSAQDRKHNRLSVAPYLVVDYSLAVSGATTEVRIDLTNEGVGPAIVQPLEIIVAGGQDSVRGDWSEVAAVADSAGFNSTWSWNFRGGEAIGVQRGKTLFRLVGPTSRRPALDSLMEKVNVVIRYESIYGDTQTTALKTTAD